MLEVPENVWNNIFQHVEPKDIYAMALTLKLNYEQLTSNGIWGEVVWRNWLSTLDDYELLNSPYPQADYYRMFCEFSKIQADLEEYIRLCRPYEPKYNIENIFERFGKRESNVAVAYNVLRRLREKQFEDYKNMESYVFRIGLLESLMNYLNCSIFLRKLLQNMDKMTSADPRDFEKFYFDLSLYDKSFHHLVKHRSQCHRKVEQALKKFTDNIVYNGYKGVRLNIDDAFHRIFVFEDTECYFKFIQTLIRKVLYVSKPTDQIVKMSWGFRYREGIFLLRYYSGLCKGNGNLLLAIVSKYLYNFFTKTKIHIITESPEPYNPEIILYDPFIKVGNGHLFLINVDHPDSHDVPFVEYTTQNSLSQALSLGWHVNFSKEPNTLEWVITCFLRETALCYSSIIMQLNYKEYNLSQARLNNIKKVFTHQDDDTYYRILIDIADWLDIERSEFDKHDFTRLFRCYPWDLDVYIIMKCIATIGTDPYLISQLEDIKKTCNWSTVEDGFTSCFSLDNMRCSLLRIEPEEEVLENGPFENGTLVFNHKWGYSGMVVRSKKPDYYFVFTEKNQMCVYNSNSLSKVGLDPWSLNLRKIFYNSVDMGKLGILFNDIFI